MISMRLSWLSVPSPALSPHVLRDKAIRVEAEDVVHSKEFTLVLHIGSTLEAAVDAPFPSAIVELAGAGLLVD